MNWNNWVSDIWINIYLLGIRRQNLFKASLLWGAYFNWLFGSKYSSSGSSHREDELEGEETLPWRFDVEAVRFECKFFPDPSLSFLLFL